MSISLHTSPLSSGVCGVSRGKGQRKRKEKEGRGENMRSNGGKGGTAQRCREVSSGTSRGGVEGEAVALQEVGKLRTREDTVLVLEAHTHLSLAGVFLVYVM
jgi:hypothetical protein